jgi:hypothetical protein
MAHKKLTLATITITLTATALLLVLASSAILTSSQTLHSQGALTPLQTTINIGAYSDSACTQNATNLDWGTLSPGESTTRTVYLKNTGNSNATLSMTTNTWTPAIAGQGISLTWNRQNTIIAPNAVIQTTLTLSVSMSVDRSFTSYGFNIVVTGTDT